MVELEGHSPSVRHPIFSNRSRNLSGTRVRGGWGFKYRLTGLLHTDKNWQNNASFNVEGQAPKLIRNRKFYDAREAFVATVVA